MWSPCDVHVWSELWSAKQNPNYHIFLVKHHSVYCLSSKIDAVTIHHYSMLINNVMSLFFTTNCGLTYMWRLFKVLVNMFLLSWEKAVTSYSLICIVLSCRVQRCRHFYVCMSWRFKDFISQHEWFLVGHFFLKVINTALIMTNILITMVVTAAVVIAMRPLVFRTS